MARLVTVVILQVVEGIRGVTVAIVVGEAMEEAVVVSRVFLTSFQFRLFYRRLLLPLTRRSTPFASLSGRCAIKPRSAG